MTKVTAFAVITLRCGGGPRETHASAYWKDLEYWGAGPDAVGEVVRRLLADGYPSGVGAA
jgi:hypothetical protein